ncbi:zinc finger protein 691-like isoform X2 [Thamnophis elegans]|nr:zinc finger protein 691-like isoform X2 [Thamnophis elegans]XP_032084393.1 zinc finger protein 691-like isoform X2 [Thamnophis elegans]
MPPRKRRAIGQVQSKAKKMKHQRRQETPEERKRRLATQRARAATSRASETVHQREARLQDNRDRARRSRMARHLSLALEGFHYDAHKDYSQQAAMAESSAVGKLTLAEPFLKKVSNCNSGASPSQKHLSAFKPEPLCIDENPAIMPAEGKDKECTVNTTIFGLDASQCFHCLITFPDEKFKERHMKREHPEEFIQANLQDALFLCFVCKKAFQSSQALTCHQRGHASPSPSDCSDGLRPTFDCPDCGRRFDQLANYQHHRLGHTASCSLPHQCPYCSKSYRQISSLRQHLAFHGQTQVLLPSRPYSCTECGGSFSHEAGLHDHYIRHARGEL